MPKTTKSDPIEIIHVPIDDLLPADYNPRTIDDRNAAGLKNSLAEFGFVDPVIVNRRGNRIVGGHQRLEAAKALGLTEAPVVYLDLTDERERVLNLALNKFSGEWDLPKLIDVLEQLPVDLQELAGFDPEELQAVRFHYRRKNRAAENSDADRYGRNNHPELPANPVSQFGDVYKVGPHLVVCGDATDPAVWELIGDQVRLVVTSPPYPGAGMWNTDAEGDALDANIDRLRQLGLDVLDRSLAAADVVCWNIADVPVAAGRIARNTNDVRNHLDGLALEYREIIWDKGIPILPPVSQSRRPVINSITNELVFVATSEPVFVVYPDGWKAREKKSGLTDTQNEWQLRSVWNIAPAKRSQIGHVAPFPIELAERCIYLYSLVGDLVVDPFGGAGSTLLAAENTGRTAALIELEPGWVDLLLARVAEATDYTPELVSRVDQ